MCWEGRGVRAEEVQERGFTAHVCENLNETQNQELTFTVSEVGIHHQSSDFVIVFAQFLFCVTLSDFIRDFFFALQHKWRQLYYATPKENCFLQLTY